MLQKGTKNFHHRASLAQKLFCALCAFLWLPLAASAQKKVDPNKFAVIINGPGGEAAYAQTFEQWTEQLRSTLCEKFEFDRRNIRVLSEEADEPATAAGVRKTFAEL